MSFGFYDMKNNPNLCPPTEESLASYLAKTGAQVVSGEFIRTHLPHAADQFSTIFYKGNLDLLLKPCASIVGTRSPTAEGIARAKKVTATLIDLGFVVVSGLAKGIDTTAHQTALQHKAFTAAVLGTPIHKVYPAENKTLALEIEQRGLILSSALPHEETGRYLFPRRNRLMALLSCATIIIEAGETSGVVHQAAECLKQKRKLILLKSLADNKALSWPAGFIKSGAYVIETPEDLRDLLTECLLPIKGQIKFKEKARRGLNMNFKNKSPYFFVFLNMATSCGWAGEERIGPGVNLDFKVQIINQSSRHLEVSIRNESNYMAMACDGGYLTEAIGPQQIKVYTVTAHKCVDDGSLTKREVRVQGLDQTYGFNATCLPNNSPIEIFCDESKCEKKDGIGCS